MNSVQAILANIASTATVIAITAFVLRESFSRMLDRHVEHFKHGLQIQAKRHEFLLRSQIDYKERQLSDLYGPVYASLKRGRALVRFWKEGKLRDIEPQFWALARKTNELIEETLLNKSHLIEGDLIPRSFVQFMTHVPIWHAFMETHHGSVPFSPDDFAEAYYPESFEDEIYATTERLKKELHDLYQQFGLAVAADRASEDA